MLKNKRFNVTCYNTKDVYCGGPNPEIISAMKENYMINFQVNGHINLMDI